MVSLPHIICDKRFRPPTTLYNSPFVTSLSRKAEINKLIKNKKFLTRCRLILKQETDHSGGKYYKVTLQQPESIIRTLHRYRVLPANSEITLNKLIITTSPHISRFDRYNILGTVDHYPHLIVDVTDIIDPPPFTKIKDPYNLLQSINYTYRDNSDLLRKIRIQIDYLNHKLNNPSEFRFQKNLTLKLTSPKDYKSAFHSSFKTLSSKSTKYKRSSKRNTNPPSISHKYKI